MKNQMNTNLVIRSCLALALALVIWTPVQARAAEPAEAKKTAEVSKPQISKEEATKIALKQVEKGTVKSSELETEKGPDGKPVQVWSFDIQDGKQIKEVWVDAATGKVVKTEMESPAKEKQETKKDEAPKPQISKEEATKIALKQVEKGTVKSSELETEKGSDGKPVQAWSFDIQDGKQIKEVWVDAATGKVVKTEMESPAKEKQETKKEAAQTKHEK